VAQYSAVSQEFRAKGTSYGKAKGNKTQDQATGSFPGFKMLLGSHSPLIDRITWGAVSPCSISMQGAFAGLMPCGLGSVPFGFTTSRRFLG